MTFPDLVASIDRAAQAHLGGVTVRYETEAGVVVDDIKGMFDEPYLLTDPGQFGVQQSEPVVTVRLSDLPSDPQDDEPLITIGGKEYSVKEAQPDGMGAVRLLLLESQ